MFDKNEMIFEEFTPANKPATKEIMKHNRFVLTQIIGVITAFTLSITAFNIL